MALASLVEGFHFVATLSNQFCPSGSMQCNSTTSEAYSDEQRANEFPSSVEGKKILPPLNAERIVLIFMVDTCQHCEFLRVQSQGKSHWPLFIFAQRSDQVRKSSSAPRGWEASKHRSDISCVTGACSL